jgi:hypothetical protein
MVIDAFGTHYLSSITLGAKFCVVTLINSTFHSQYSQEVIREQVKLGFFFEEISIGLNVTFQNITEKIMQEFKQNSERIAIYTPERFSGEEKSQQWLENAYNNPSVIGLEAHLITDLVAILGYQEVAHHLLKTINHKLKTGKYPDSPDEFLIMTSSVNIKNSYDDLPTIPGIDKVGCGYDITKLQYKACLLEISEFWDTWTNPFDADLKYKIPKGFFVQNMPMSVSVNGTYMIDNMKDYLKKSTQTIHEDYDGF